MTPSKLSLRIISEKVAWIRSMITRIKNLPLSSYAEFKEDRRNYAAAESYLRRAMEALLDLGRHILAKGFGKAVVEYKEIANQLLEMEVLDKREGDLLRKLAGYRNRLVHFYDEISEKELYEICSTKLGDIETILNSLLKWIENHPEKVNKNL